MDNKNEKNNRYSYDLNYKVGIKILSDTQLANVFPNYRELLDKIELYRDKARKLPEDYDKKPQYNLMFDNVFSIMGKRGTGKTSVAFTLKTKIEEIKPKSHDMVLPIIMPEIIPNDCSVLVWLLAIIKDELTKWENEINKLINPENTDTSNAYWHNCHYNFASSPSLVKQVDTLLELSFAGKYNPTGESSFYRVVGNSVRQAEDYYKFSCEITRLWNMWADKAKRLHNTKADESCCPMLFFIFDDVDLEPQKVAELLSIIMKYLSHPNIIVITTADEEMFLEVIENNLDKNIGRLPREWRSYLNRQPGDPFWQYNTNNNIIQADDLITQTARMYLGKVLPTSTRYYLRLFNRVEEKAEFRLNDQLTLASIMENDIDDLIKTCLQQKHRTPKIPEGRINFLKISKFYLSFMGDTSRQIGNAYLGWNELFKNLKRIITISQYECSKDEVLEQIYTGCRSFLYVEINANHDLADVINHTEDFVSEVFWKNLNGWNPYVNYYYWNEFLNKTVYERKDISRKKLLKVALALYALLMTLESILLILENGIKNGITERKRTHGISSMINFITEHFFNDKLLFRMGMPADAFFTHYSTLLDRLVHSFTDIDIQSTYFYKEYLYSFIDLPYNDEEFYTINLQKMLDENREWLSSITGILTMVYGNISLIERRNIDVCWLYAAEPLKAGYQSAVDDLLYTSLLQDLEMPNLITEESEIIYLWDIIAYQNDKDSITNYIDKEIEYLYSSLSNNDSPQFVTLTWALEYIFQKYEKEWQIQNVSWYASYINIPIGVDLGDDIIYLLQQFRYFVENKILLTEYICISDLPTWADRVQAVCGENQTIDNLLLKIMREKEYIPPKSHIGYVNAKYYTEIKAILERTYVRVQYRNRLESDDTLSDIKDLFSEIDYVINSNDKNELRKACELGFGILSIHRLQLYYLHNKMITKYQNAHRLSARGVEFTNPDNAEKNKTYYYNLYLKICDIISNDYPGESTLKTFLSQAVRSEINRYLDSMIRGTEDEQRTH